MADAMDYPDLSKPLSGEGDYPDLSRPMASGNQNGPGLGETMKFASELMPGPLGAAARLGHKIPGALSQIGKDVATGVPEAYKGIIHGIGKIPEAVDYLKENVPAAGRLAMSNPAAAGRSAAAGGAEFLGKVSRLPPGVAKYLVHIGMMSPEAYEAMAKPPSEEQFQQWGNKIEGEPQPGGGLIRGAFRNPENVYGGARLASLINPLRYTKGAITKDVLNTALANKLKYSGPKGIYRTLFNDARTSGLGGFQNLDVTKMNIPTLEKYTPRKPMEAIKAFADNPTLENAQAAVSQLGSIIRPLENRTTLEPFQKKQLQAAEKAKEHIQKNMFMDQSGKVDDKFLERHRKVQSGYAEDVIPYTTNKAIKDYKKGDITQKELIQKLSKGKFAARKGSVHPEIARRKLIKPAIKFGLGAELVHQLGWDQTILNKLLNKD